MNNVFVRQLNITYSIKMNNVKQNIELIKSLLNQLKEQQPRGVKYTVHLMGENVFIHMAQFSSEEANQLFNQLEAFRKFRQNLKDRLLENPITNEVQELGCFISQELAE